MDMKLEDDGNCFVCGKNNPGGLKLSFHLIGGKITSEFTPSVFHQGYKNITHGGVITAVLDEAMIQAALNCGLAPVTADINVRFRKPLVSGRRARVEAEIIRKGSRLIEARARLTASGDGELIADARAKLLIK